MAWAYTTLLIGDVNDVHHQVEQNQPLSLLFIDADGAIDRDFRLFYNRLLDNAPIIIDDCKNIINRHARENYLKWTTPEEIDEYVKSKGAKNFVDLCPLGKEYTTFRFINYFMARGLLLQEKMIGATFFGRKSAGALFDPEIDGKALFQIRREIEKEYYLLNPNLKKEIEG